MMTLRTAAGGCSGALGYTTVILLSCATNANAFPLGEKAQPCTHAAVLFKNSPQTVLNGKRSPHTLGSGRASTPLTKLLKTRA